MTRRGAFLIGGAVAVSLALVATALSFPAPGSAQPDPILNRMWVATEVSLEEYESTAKQEDAALRDGLTRAARARELLGTSQRDLAAASALASAMEQVQVVLDAEYPSRSSRLAALQSLNDAISATGEEIGFQAQLEGRIAAVDPDATFGVYVRDISRGKTILEVDANRSFPAASTYKIFVAQSMIEAVAAGERTWSDRFLGSLNLGECFDEMIVESDNACPELWLEQVGPEAVQKRVRALGLTDTTVEWGAMRTTAADLGRAIEQLVVGEALPRAGRERLRSAMESQEFREGVPAGIPVAKVADKVGFLDEHLHDAALISSPKGDFVMVILTSNASWEEIAEVAALIYSEL